MEKSANDDAFLRITEKARAFDRQTVAALAAAPVDASVPSLSDRTVIAVGMRSVGPTPTDVYLAVLEAARERDPHAVGWDEEEWIDVLADPTWVAAWEVTHYACVGRGYAAWLTPEEQHLLVGPWESVMGTR